MFVDEKLYDLVLRFDFLNQTMNRKKGDNGCVVCLEKVGCL